jgi:hypothetical protein
VSPAIDVNLPSTWPRALREAVRGIRADSAVTDDEMSEHLAGRNLRTYHSTRLLPHEASRIRHEGLRRLSPSLISGKLSEAVRVGAIDGEMAAQLATRSVLQSGCAPGREGQVWLTLGLEGFATEQWGVEPLLGTWGGEGIYWCIGGSAQHSLRQIGSPSIVVVDLPFDPARTRTFPSLSQVFRAQLSDDPDSDGYRHADVRYVADVRPSAVVDIWQPGMREYDRFDGLPGTPGAIEREEERLAMQRQELHEKILRLRGSNPSS